MAKRLKKAFTITELVIVIAVVAILAAVLIPTFSNIIKKADESADTQLVKNLNTILSSEQTVSQEAAPTMSKALEQAQSGGYTVDKLTPTSDGDILWEQDSNRFVLVSGGEIIFKDSTTTADIATEPYKFWKITNKESEVTDGEYSHYLADGFTGTAFTVKAGIDTGENTTVTSITYSSPVKSAPAAGAERTVIINTNKNRCNVTVDALFDTVKRYGDAETVSVNYTASQSYHEFGDVNTLVVGEGHVYVDEGGYVGILDCTKAGNATVGKASTGTINSVLVKDDSSAGSILEDSVKTAIENGETEQVKASDVPAESSLFAGGIGTEKSPFLIETAEQFVAIGQLSDDMKNGISYHFELANNIDLRSATISDTAISQYFCGAIDGNGFSITANDRLEGIFLDAVGQANFKDILYKLNTENVLFCAGIKTPSQVKVVYDNFDITTVEKDTVIVLQEDNEGLYYGWTGCSNITFGWETSYRFELVIQNCDVDVDISANGYNAVFIGGGLYNTDVLVQNCTYSGDYYGAKVNLVLGNLAPYNGNITIKNVVNAGGLYGTARVPAIAGGVLNDVTSEPAEDFVRIENCDIGVIRFLNDNALSIEKDLADETIVIGQAEASATSYYVLTLVGGTRVLPPYGENSSYRFSIRLNAEFMDGKFDTGYTDGKLITVAQYHELIDDTAVFNENEAVTLEDDVESKFWVIENEGVTYYVFDFADDNYYFAKKVNGESISQAVDVNSALVTAYDNAGLPIAQKSLQLR